ncbi:hypothetical protein MAR_000314 [Mya arenaria]|uniref:Uncharacterized protein n=1 Tax=Mya arenaria TaxID=6604 RepID=A0ABY7FGW2_MYAAR|nr:hypothetical protein MAR_000314 [Mya arenaria]
MATSTQTQVDSHPTLGAVSFTKYNCAVSKRKESEQFLDSLFDGFRLDSPRDVLYIKTRMSTRAPRVASILLPVQIYGFTPGERLEVSN